MKGLMSGSTLSGVGCILFGPQISQSPLPYRLHLNAYRWCGVLEIPPTRLCLTLYLYNLACVAMSENPVRRKYSLHIDIRRYFVRDLVAQNVLKLIPLRTSLMVADALTKSLPAPAHAKHRNVMIGRVPFSVRTLRPSHCVLGG